MKFHKSFKPFLIISLLSGVIPAYPMGQKAVQTGSRVVRQVRPEIRALGSNLAPKGPNLASKPAIAPRLETNKNSQIQNKNGDFSGLGSKNIEKSAQVKTQAKPVDAKASPMAQMPRWGLYGLFKGKKPAPVEKQPEVVQQPAQPEIKTSGWVQFTDYMKKLINPAPQVTSLVDNTPLQLEFNGNVAMPQTASASVRAPQIKRVQPMSGVVAKSPISKISARTMATQAAPVVAGKPAQIEQPDMSKALVVHTDKSANDQINLDGIIKTQIPIGCGGRHVIAQENNNNVYPVVPYQDPVTAVTNSTKQDMSHALVPYEHNVELVRTSAKQRQIEGRNPFAISYVNDQEDAEIMSQSYQQRGQRDWSRIKELIAGLAVVTCFGMKLLIEYEILDQLQQKGLIGSGTKVDTGMVIYDAQQLEDSQLHNALTQNELGTYQNNDGTVTIVTQAGSEIDQLLQQAGVQVTNSINGINIYAGITTQAHHAALQNNQQPLPILHHNGQGALSALPALIAQPLAQKFQLTDEDIAVKQFGAQVLDSARKNEKLKLEWAGQAQSLNGLFTNYNLMLDYYNSKEATKDDFDMLQQLVIQTIEEALQTHQRCNI